MQKVLVLIIGVVLLAAACNCGSSFSRSAAPESLALETSSRVPEAEVGPRENRRLMNKEFIARLVERTVSIRFDCSPKKGVVVVGSDIPAEKRNDSRGTGVIVRSYNNKSYIFTAAHVVEVDDAAEKKWFTCKIYVQKSADAGSSDNEMIAAVVVEDTHRDIAVLEVKKDLGVNTELETDPFTGEDVWAVGYPVQKASPRSIVLSVTKGTLATKNVPGSGSARRNGYYHRITSQIYYGNSGGGVWTKEGKLVGIVVIMYTVSGVPYEGYYYIRPVNEMINLLKRRWKYDSVLGR